MCTPQEPEDHPADRLVGMKMYGAYVTWMRDDMAEEFGLITEEDKQRFFAEQERLAAEEGRRRHEKRMEICRGKSIEDIPDGDYCYTRLLPEGFSSEEELQEYLAAKYEDEVDQLTAVLMMRQETLDCPYWLTTDYGFCCCDFLEVQAVGWDGESYQKALAHFGSAEEVEKHNTAGIAFSDACRICEGVVKQLREEAGSGRQGN